MMNETSEFEMARMLDIGPERMLERAKAKGMVVPLRGYTVYVYGATPQLGFTPHAWLKVKQFWEMYFAACGIELVTYSPECDLAELHSP